jgi:hypothetical protein
MMVMATLIIMFYSKLILTRQTQSTDQGQRLAELYSQALLFVDQLQTGADGMLHARSESDRMIAARALGKAEILVADTQTLLAEAESRGADQPVEVAGKPIVEALNALAGADSLLWTAGEHVGPLTADETKALTVARDGAIRMKTALSGFRPPSGEAGFRQMMTIADWVAPARAATKQLEQTAQALNK